MDPRPFRPSVDGLETRLVPSADPTEVVAAYTRTVGTADNLYELGTTLERGRTSRSISFLATMLPQAALQSRTDAVTLNQYRTEIQSAVAANPALGASLQQFIMQLAGAEAQATLNSGYADLYAIGFGGTPISPPPPPPPPPGDGDNPIFGPDSSGGSTSPPPPPAASTLPFSLTDSNFRTLSDGVRVWDTVVGGGTAITTGSQFTATYTGYLTNGTVFDSGTLPNTTLNTSNLIPGFVSGLNGMQVGGTRRIVIPAALAYGSAGRTGIPPNSDLVFEVTLVSSP
jgi:peptidylprolyl isomerase